MESFSSVALYLKLFDAIISRAQSVIKILADVIIEPDLSAYPILGLPPKKVDELITIGYQEAMNAIECIQVDPVTGIVTIIGQD